MTARLFCRNILATVLLTLSVSFAYAQAPLRWLNAGTTNAEFETTLMQYLQSEKQFQIQNQPIQPGELKEELGRIDSTK